MDGTKHNPLTRPPDEFHLRIAAARRADAFYSVAFSPDGRFIASGSDDTTVKLWEVSSGKLIRSLEGHQNWVRSVAFSPDRRFIASGSDDNTVIEQLAGQGEIVETRLSSGDRVLVLQIGFISIYAGSLVLAARDNQKGVPALEELLVVSGRTLLPGIKPEERADPLRERIVLECTVQLLLDRGLCFKHEGMLIFPTEFKQLEAADGERAARTVTIYYDFTGAIDNIWASLVTQLAMGGENETGFGRVRLWKNHAEFEKPGQGVCGLRKIDRQSGSAHLDLLFSEKVSTETRDLFIGFVDTHLRKEGVEIKEGWKMVCANGHPFDEEAIKARRRARPTSAAQSVIRAS